MKFDFNCPCGDTMHMYFDGSAIHYMPQLTQYLLCVCVDGLQSKWE